MKVHSLKLWEVGAMFWSKAKEKVSMESLSVESSVKIADSRM